MITNEIVEGIYRVFVDYFGEERVDLQEYDPVNPIYASFKLDTDVNCQGCFFIFVHWPAITITNECDCSIDIWDLYALTIVKPDGKMLTPPQFLRSTYDDAQWNSGYIHSHIQSLEPSSNNIHRFRRFCFGTGPIVRTIDHLMNDSYNDDAMLKWNLYCWELDKAVAVESLTGIPYMKLQYVTGINSSATNTYASAFLIRSYIPKKAKSAPIELLKAVLKEIIESKILKFAFVDGKYVLATSYIETVLTISNFFIDLYNTKSYIRDIIPQVDELFNKGILETKVCLGDKLYSPDSSRMPIEALAETPLFVFKGNWIKLQLKDSNQAYDKSNVTVLNLELIDYIVYVILKYVNLNYGKPEDTIDKKTRVL